MCEIFGRKENQGKNFPKLSQTSFSGISIVKQKLNKHNPNAEKAKRLNTFNLSMFQNLCHFITSRIFNVEAKFKLFWKVYHKDNMNIHTKFKNYWDFWLFQWSWTKWTFLPRDLPFSKFQKWNLRNLFWKTECTPHFVWRSRTIKGTFLSFSLVKKWMNMNEFIVEL